MKEESEWKLEFLKHDIDIEIDACIRQGLLVGNQYARMDMVDRYNFVSGAIHSMYWLGYLTREERDNIERILGNYLESAPCNFEE